MQYIRSRPAAPQFDDVEKTRIARLLMTFLWGSIVIAVVTLPPVLLVSTDPWLTIGVHLSAIVLSLLSMWLVRQGNIKGVPLALPIAIALLVLVSLLFGQRPFHIGAAAGLIAVVFTGILGRWRTLIAVVSLNIAVTAVVVVYWLWFVPHPFNAHDLLIDGMSFIWYCIIMGFVVMLSTNQLRAALERAGQARLEVNNRNRALEREVAERRQTESDLAMRTRELTQLLEMSKRVSATLDLRHLLDLVVELLQPVVNYNSITISEYLGKGQMLTLTHRGNLPLLAKEWFIDLALDCHLADALEGHGPVVISDIRADTVLARAYRDRQVRLKERVPDHVACVAYVPLVSRNKVIGLMTLGHAVPNAYTVQSLRLVAAFANQIAVSIENARLHEKAVQAAALTERSRLARELHDSVSQALFGIVLGSRTLLNRSALGDTPQTNTVEYVLSLAEAALAEMRALIFELRPESLQSEGLVIAFRRQAEALCARHKIEVKLDDLACEPELSIEAKESLYRIGLEAIQNTIKHAHATRVNLRLTQENGKVLLEIVDNGCGFDMHTEYPGHFGLHTMRERAEQFGGSLVLQSAQGTGTQVQVKLPILVCTHAYTDQTTRIQFVDTVQAF